MKGATNHIKNQPIRQWFENCKLRCETDNLYRIPPEGFCKYFDGIHPHCTEMSRRNVHLSSNYDACFQLPF